MLDSLLFSAARVWTFIDKDMLTSASGFFYEVGARLFLVTSRHVLLDADSEHHPTRIEIELHTDAENLAASTGFSMPLYQNGKSVWRDGRDSEGPVDVAVVEIERAALPRGAVVQAFTPAHLPRPDDAVEIGSSLLVVGFPLGFHDTLHHLPVVRGAVVASAFGVRFQGQGCFVTDAPMHRGSSGAPVLRHLPEGDPDLPWQLLGVHASRMDMRTRDDTVDASLGLNLAWYADVLMALTD